MYNFNHLFTFMRVAELGSFNKYAEEEYISPNAVMKQINNLENELGGLRLFERTNRGIVLTETGEYLYREAKAIIEECEESRQRVIMQGKVKSNTIRIAMPYYAMLGYFKDILEKIHAEHPEIYLEIVNSGSNMKELIALWKNFSEWTDITCDCFADENPAGDWYGERFEYLTLAEKPMCCMMSTTHRLAQKDVLTLEDFEGCELHIIDLSVDESMRSLRERVEDRVTEIRIVEHEYYNGNMLNDCANGVCTLR